MCAGGDKSSNRWLLRAINDELISCCAPPPGPTCLACETAGCSLVGFQEIVKYLDRPGGSAVINNLGGKASKDEEGCGR